MIGAESRPARSKSIRSSSGLKKTSFDNIEKPLERGKQLIEEVEDFVDEIDAEKFPETARSTAQCIL